MKNKEGSCSSILYGLVRGLFLSVGFLLFAPTGLLLMVAAKSLLGWGELAGVAFFITGLTLSIGVLGLVANKFWSFAGMLFVVLDVASYGSAIVRNALDQNPPTIVEAAAFAMSFGIVVSLMTLWWVVRHRVGIGSWVKNSFAPAKTTTAPSHSAGTAINKTP